MQEGGSRQQQVLRRFRSSRSRSERIQETCRCRRNPKRALSECRRHLHGNAVVFALQGQNCLGFSENPQARRDRKNFLTKKTFPTSPAALTVARQPRVRWRHRKSREIPRRNWFSSFGIELEPWRWTWAENWHAEVFNGFRRRWTKSRNHWIFDTGDESRRDSKQCGVHWWNRCAEVSWKIVFFFGELIGSFRI